MAQQLLSRYGVVTREVAASEGFAGGFGAVYDVLKALEDAGRMRRGYFVGGVGANQFALPPALELLRSLRETPESVESLVARGDRSRQSVRVTLKWPELRTGEQTAGRGPTRTVGALVVLVNGGLAAYVPRGGRQIVTGFPRTSRRDRRSRAHSQRHWRDSPATRLAAACSSARSTASRLPTHRLTPFLVEAGFYPSAMGLQMRRAAASVGAGDAASVRYTGGHA